jgi:hypothetical protein
MINQKWLTKIITTIVAASCAFPVFAQEKGANSITANELRKHLSFIASDELEGRDTPSVGLKTAARYIAAHMESYGLKSLMPDGSYMQRIDLPVTSLDTQRTILTLINSDDEHELRFPQEFGVASGAAGEYSGELVFLGNPSESQLASYKLRGKIVVILDETPPEEQNLLQSFHEDYEDKISTIYSQGAAGVLIVINELRESDMEKRGYNFDVRQDATYFEENVTRWQQVQENASWWEPEDEQPEWASLPLLEIRHDVAAKILGISQAELKKMFKKMSQGEQVAMQKTSGRKITLTIAEKEELDYSQNVIAMVEGTDPILKNEYIVYSAHYDHLPIQRGRVYNGADDNGSGTVNLIEIAEAMALDPPKRSIIFAWVTGEEKDLWGSRYFLTNPLIPLEKISANINHDMNGRNHEDSVWIIGARLMSSDMEKSVIDVNEKYMKKSLRLSDYAFSYSDNYIFSSYGIPTVSFFSGEHDQTHHPDDAIDLINFEKMESYAKYAYYLGHEIGNKNEMLKLDIDPAISGRGNTYLVPRTEGIHQ